jgi:hypothetical protein
MDLLRPALLLVAPLAFLALHARPAAAETLTCTTLSALPATISTAGHYCLNANFSQNFAASPVTINASNVLLECNDRTITNTGAGAPNGITVNNQSQVTVRNCNLNGFGRGIAFYETVVGASRNNHVEHNDVRRSKVAGILVGGTANLVEYNRVSENLGGAGGATYGILVNSAGNAGVGNVVRKNIVGHIAPSVYVTVWGIYLLDVDNTLVANNTVTALFPPLDLYAHGIVGGLNSLGNAAIGNTVITAANGSTPPGGGGGMAYWGASGDGIRFNADPSATNRNACRGNVVGHWTTNILAESASAGCVKDANTEY